MTRGRRIQITTDDGTAEAYATGPATQDGPLPGVLLFMDAIGLRPRIEEMADRIADWGYAVLAPNVFYRHGTAADIAPTTDLRLPGEREKFFPTVMPLVASHTPDEAARDLPAYVAALAGQPDVDASVLGVTGYCMGARLALRAAAQLPDQVRAVGMFHGGGIVTDADDSPHLVVPRLHAEVVAGHADHDGSMPPEAIAAFDTALREAGVRATTAVYPGAPHGYTMADTSMYDEAATERHFTELRELFARALR
ncbi:dienelactone hydrolase family protein [Nocardioides hwasunensis]|uniref:Dienelactone hydrolase family protein n=1 Tax=Nocardioides hwasunensis TaxID=397258 RepID=A0ABR8MIS7_9ACTN|nr:dienelactone hydrolase family protein [Nocardioides hwasunensis]MBD3915908.1 dienelactone hydrolase family protein [Nocardioides hwasunensis]